MFILIILLTSCSSTHLTSSWKAPDATAQKYNKILVLGMAGSKDRDIRESMENAMVQKLKDVNINANSATDIYGPKTFENMTEKEAIDMVDTKGFDGIIILSLLDQDQESNYTPGYISRTPYAVLRSHWYPYYRVLYDRTYTPGYYTTTTNYTLEANLYSTRGKLQYSAQAKSFDPNNAESLSNDFSKALINDMMQKAVIIK